MIRSFNFQKPLGSMKLLSGVRKEKRFILMAKPLGMMSGCYFVGRKELLAWLNDLLAINYTRVEDTSNGAAFCQVIDAIHPGTVALTRVNYNATNVPEMLENYKVLQDSFNKNKISQYLDIPTLTKGRYMAALELFQWIHGYYKQTEPHEEYDAVGRRKQCHCAPPNEKTFIGKPKPADIAHRKGVAPIEKPTIASNEVGQLPGRVKPENPVVNRQNNNQEEPQSSKSSAKPQKVKNIEKESGRKKIETNFNSSPTNNSSKALEAEIAALKADKRKLLDEKDEMSTDINQLNAERDFYYGKLRRIEDFCQDHENETNIDKILQILYEPDEEHGFLAPEEEDNE